MEGLAFSETFFEQPEIHPQAQVDSRQSGSAESYTRSCWNDENAHPTRVFKTGFRNVDGLDSEWSSAVRVQYIWVYCSGVHVLSSYLSGFIVEVRCRFADNMIMGLRSRLLSSSEGKTLKRVITKYLATQDKRITIKRTEYTPTKYPPRGKF